MANILKVWDEETETYVSLLCLKGDSGEQGPKGDPGSGFKILDYYDTLSLLEAAVTTPNVGDVYGVGSSYPYDIYIYSATNGWVNNGSIQGAKGEKGDKGDPGEQGPKGDPFTFSDFTQDQLASLKGEKGDPGITPVRGVDYFTDTDKSEIVDAVLAELLNGDEVSY